ncbi:MAG TPA: hypothetical protein VFR62_10085 [Gemmatimonadales bacterium]|nr:hypothetical protein [Gemmatimonadales bacterium]
MRMPPFPTRSTPVTLGAMRRSTTSTALLLAGVLACGMRAETGPLPSRPPAPLDSMPLASDVRVDSTGHLVGSFVGEGTSRAVHLLSSDTLLIRTLAARFRPDLLTGERDLWATLRWEDSVPLGRSERRRTMAGRGPGVARAMVGSPLGHTDVSIAQALLRGSRCPGDTRGARLELVVRPDSVAGDPPLRGPVLGTFLAADEAGRRERGLVRREPLAEPSPELVDRLIDRTSAFLDSVLTARYPGLQVRPIHSDRVEVNSLADLGAADVIPFRAGQDRIRYAVSLRQRRVLSGRDTLVTTGVMVWDSAGSWRQEVFRPTVLASVGGRLDAFGPIGRPVYWRRLQPISDVAYARDNIWMEQVNVRDGRVVWGIIQPAGNVVVAAAEVEGVCG